MRTREAFEHISCTSMSKMFASNVQAISLPHDGQQRLTLIVNLLFSYKKSLPKKAGVDQLKGKLIIIACGAGPWCVDREVQLGLANWQR